jgi:hypothetical protein
MSLGGANKSTRLVNLALRTTRCKSCLIISALIIRACLVPYTRRGPEILLCGSMRFADVV